MSPRIPERSRAARQPPFKATRAGTRQETGDPLRPQPVRSRATIPPLRASCQETDPPRDRGRRARHRRPRKEREHIRVPPRKGLQVAPPQLSRSRTIVSRIEFFKRTP
jgi:hypothetical protein